MYNTLSDKLTDSTYIHSLVETQAKYDESDENPNYYGDEKPAEKKAAPEVKIAPSHA